MGWLGRLLGATPKEELEGIKLNMQKPYWELEGKTDFPHLLRALVDLLPDGSIVYFEGGTPNKRMRKFFAAHAIPEPVHIAIGIIWPKPLCYHVPATEQNLEELAKIGESCAWPELAIHFHAHHEGKVILEWHDAFADLMFVSGEIPEDKVREFARALSMAMEHGKIEQS